MRQYLAPVCGLWLVLPPRPAHSAYGAHGLLVALMSQRRRCLPNMSISFSIAWLDQITSLSWVNGATQEESETVQECAWELLMGFVAIRADERLTMSENTSTIALLWPPRMSLQARSLKYKPDRRAVKE